MTKTNIKPITHTNKGAFFKKIQDWTLKSERILKRIFCFFIKQIDPRSLGSWCIKGTEESTLKMDSSVPLMHHDPRDLGLICVIKKHKIRFRILSDLRIQSWIFLKKRTLRLPSQSQTLSPGQKIDRNMPTQHIATLLGATC